VDNDVDKCDTYRVFVTLLSLSPESFELEQLPYGRLKFGRSPGLLTFIAFPTKFGDFLIFD
jgi:hypothetical protein